MKFPLMTVLVITDEPKKWAHEVLKFLNKEYLINKHYKYSNVGYDITTPPFRFLIAKDTERIGIGYRFNFVVYDKFVDEDIRCDLLGRTRDIYTNRCWIDSGSELYRSTTTLHWYQKLWSRIKGIFTNAER